MMDPTTLDDHAFAVWAAERAGTVLLDVRRRAGADGLEGKALKDAGDAAAQAELDRILTELRPDDSVLSEEAADDKSRLTARRVWIIDPLDGTREFSEPPRDDWAVHVALLGGRRPGRRRRGPAGAGRDVQHRSTQRRPAADLDRPRIAVSRSRPPAFVEALAAELDAELVPMGSAGVKVMSVVRDIADAYVHAGGQYQWDNAAPVVVARAAGLHCSRVDGSPLVYNADDTSLPDLIVCRPELAEQIVDFVRETERPDHDFLRLAHDRRLPQRLRALRVVEGHCWATSMSRATPTSPATRSA